MIISLIINFAAVQLILLNERTARKAAKAAFFVLFLADGHIV